MQNGNNNNRAQPHAENTTGADDPHAHAMSKNPSAQRPRPQISAATPPAAQPREGGDASVNSPYFFSPKGTASVFSASANPDGSHRHPTFEQQQEEGEDVYVMDGRPVTEEKAGVAAGTVVGGDGARRRPAGRAADATGPYSPAGDAGSGRNQPFHHSINGKGGDGDEEGSSSDATPPSHVVDCTSARPGEGGGAARSAHQHFSESFRNQSYVKELPDHLVPLAHEIHQLDDDDLAYISEVTHTMANRDLYSLLPYTGSNWFLPSIRECEEDEKRWALQYTWREGLIIAIGGRRLSIRLLNVFIRLCFIVLIWFMLWNMLPHKLVQPGGYVWDPAVLVVVSAIIGGLVCRIIQMPPLVGVLWMGIMWNNIPTLKYLTHGIVKEVFDICSKLGLTVILARAGYKLAIKEIIPHWKQTALLATLPFAFEGVAHSLIANKIFDYKDNYNWAFLQGMLCSIVSPAVVVPGSLYLQDLGYGRGVGPLSLMLSAVGIEIVIGVWCANFIIGLIFYNQRLVVAIILGPVQFIGGILIGVALGIVFYYVVELIKQEADRLPNGKYTRSHLNSCMDFSYCIFLFACYTMVFLGYHLSLAGGGCVMCVFFSATVAHMWTRTGKSEHEEHKKYMAHWLALTWDQAMMPILFATMGAKINVKAIFNATFFPKAIICMACSTAVRVIVIFVVQLGSGMPYKEKLLVCVGYLGKASAQASVGPIAANLVASMIAALPVDQRASLATMAEYANNVQQISAMYVMFMACVASFGLVRGGQMVLKREGDGKKKKKNTNNNNGSDSASVAGGAAPTGAVAEGTNDGDSGSLQKQPAATAVGPNAREGSLMREPSSAHDHHVSFATFEPLHRDDEVAGVESNGTRVH